MTDMEDFGGRWDTGKSTFAGDGSEIGENCELDQGLDFPVWIGNGRGCDTEAVP